LEQGVIMDVAKNAMMTVLYLSMPMLGISLIVGLTISIFQATTSIQDQTLTFIPKLITILASIAIFGSWMGKMMVAYTINLYDSILTIIK
jgi:flagellar biosynthetic protein FliQ